MKVQRRPHFFKRQYIVHRAMQFRVILYSAIFGVIQLLFVQMCYRIYFLNIQRKITEAGVSADHPLWIFIDRQLNFLRYFSWGIGLGLMILNLAVFVFLTHRIAGPIFRMRMIVNEWRNGSKTDLKIREGDFFHELADDLQKLKKEKLE